MNRGFSLVELLASITIVIVLGSLSFAGYNSARGKANSVECVSRLRALGQGILLYTTENGGQFPKSSHSGSSWAASVAPYLGEPVLDSSLEYRTRDVFQCPSTATSDSSSWSYGVNVFFELSSTLRYTPAGLPILGSRDSYKGSPATWNRLSAVPLPSRTVLLAENPHQVADHFMAHQWSSLLTARNAVASSRHSGKSNFAFVDGHVSTLSIEETFNPDTGLDLWNPSLAR